MKFHPTTRTRYISKDAISELFPFFFFPERKREKSTADDKVPEYFEDFISSIELISYIFPKRYIFSVDSNLFRLTWNEKDSSRNNFGNCYFWNVRSRFAFLKTTIGRILFLTCNESHWILRLTISVECKNLLGKEWGTIQYCTWYYTWRVARIRV